MRLARYGQGVVPTNPKETVMLKLGSETGSLVNHLYSRMVDGEPQPYIGMPATLLSWSDRYPATVVDVNVQKAYIVVQGDSVVNHLYDSNGNASYDFEPNPNAHPIIFKKNRKGFWVIHEWSEKGRLVQRKGQGLMLGKREYYYDPHF